MHASLLLVSSSSSAALDTFAGEPFASIAGARCSGAAPHFHGSCGLCLPSAASLCAGAAFWIVVQV